MNSETTGGVRLVAFDSFQCRVDEVTIPTCDRTMGGHCHRCPDVECLHCGKIFIGQLLTDMFRCDGPSASPRGGVFDKMLQFTHIARV
jgi:hypothetical protein